MEIQKIEDLLRSNSYPGRGILLGRSADSTHAVIAYFIMGRSENSRNRIFIKTSDGIQTQAHDPSKMTDPSLIIYHPVRVFQDTTIVTNGDQTDSIRDALAEGRDDREALLQRTFEPDEPNWTPRISGLLKPDWTYQLSILKSLYGDGTCCCRYFYEYDTPKAGMGHFIHTYEKDANPLPSFEGEPRPVTITAPNAESFAAQIWDSLNAENKVSLFVRYIEIATGKAEDIIKNKL